MNDSHFGFNRETALSDIVDATTFKIHQQLEITDDTIKSYLPF